MTCPETYIVKIRQMKKAFFRNKVHAVWALLTFLLLSACMADDEYTLLPADRLAFSVDTVAFDTVISGSPTGTYTFQVYNRNKKAIRIPTVSLESGAASPFRVNVDGTFLEGGSAGDFEIGAEDSIRVFLFVNTVPQDKDEPVEIKDKLIFVTEGGAVQEVVLTAAGQDVVTVEGLRLEKDSVFSSGRPYRIMDSLVVGEGAVLTLSEGTRLYFHAGASLIVRGTLHARGSLGKPVVLRGDRLDNMFSGQPYDRIPGQWGGVILKESSYGNELNFCDIHSGSFGIRCDSSGIEQRKLLLENSVIHNVTGDGIYSRMSQIFVGNSQITNAGGNCVTLLGGENSFIQCTIANFYAFAGGRGVALEFSNIDGAVRLPLYKAEFANCLITGYSSDELMGNQSERYPDDAYNYSFVSCLLDTPEFESEYLQDCLWDNDGAQVWREGNFTPPFDLSRLIFTFSLDPRSQAVDKGNAEVARTFYPLDILGRDRLSDTAPDIGCYEAQVSND